MVDFRYHLVSLIAVFLALACGIVLGAGPLREAIGDTVSGRNAELTAQNAQLPNNAQVGQEFVLEDLVGNFNAFPITVLPPAGDNIASAAQWILNVDKGSWKLRKYPNNFWSISRG